MDQLKQHVQQTVLMLGQASNTVVYLARNYGNQPGRRFPMDKRFGMFKRAKLSMLQCWLNSQTNRRRRSDTSLPNDKNILKNSQLHYKSTICQPSQLVRFTRVKHNQKPNKTSSNRVQRQYWRKKARNRNRNS